MTTSEAVSGGNGSTPASLAPPPPAPSDRPTLTGPPVGVPTAPSRPRNTVWIVAGLLTMLVAGVMGLSVARSLADRSNVLIATRSIAQGETIVDGDLSAAEVALDPRIGSVEPSVENDLVGQVATRPINDGAIVQRSDFAAAGDEEEAEVILGAALDAGNYPRIGLRPGDLVGLVEVSEAAVGEVVGQSRQVGEGEVVETVRITRSDHLLVSMRLKESLAVNVSQLAEEDRLRLIVLDTSDGAVVPVEPVQPGEPADPDEVEVPAGDGAPDPTAADGEGSGQ